ncbi:hypothetical protein ACFV2S_06160 [Streptomyces sp. NPDC059695]|uniref:hypothetical protein n=1 Tax=Streptomyces sp. NPDC059695 TaxID=3346910 RepID=UPI0036CF9E88
MTYVHFAAKVMRLSGTTEVTVLCPVGYAGRLPRTPVIAFVCSSIAVAGVVSVLNTAA